MFAGSLTALSVAAIPPAAADTVPPSGTPATVSADVLPTAQINGVVWAQVVVGNTVYATGSFTQARPAGVKLGGTGTVTRSNLLAYDITTGKLSTTFNHALNAQGLALAASPDGKTVYVGGDFTKVDSSARSHIAAFSTSTGALTSFAPTLGSEVRAIAATSTNVYVGGNFFSANGHSVSRLAKFTTTGGYVSWPATADDNLVNALALSSDGTKIAVAGKFASLNHATSRGIGVLSTSTGARLAWSSSFPVEATGDNAAFTSLATDGTNLYGTNYNFYSQSGTGNYEGRWSSDFAGNLRWLDACHGDSYSVWVQSAVVYSASHSHDCSDDGAFDDTNNPRIYHRAVAEAAAPSGTTLKHNNNSMYTDFYGKPAAKLLHWWPSLSQGTYTGQYQGPWSVSGNSQYIVYGGEFTTVNKIPQQGLVRFAISSVTTNPNKVGPTASSTLTPQASQYGTGKIRVTWQTTWDMDNASLTYRLYRDASTTPIATVTNSSEFWYLPWLAFVDTVPSGTGHYYHVTATDPKGNVLKSGNSATISSLAAQAQPAAAPAGTAAPGTAKLAPQDDAPQSKATAAPAGG